MEDVLMEKICEGSFCFSLVISIKLVMFHKTVKCKICQGWF